MYTRHFFAGVYWDVQDMPLENIERIEVIRGPGGTIWGPNRANGVINIITKQAAIRTGVTANRAVPATGSYNGRPRLEGTRLIS